MYFRANSTTPAKKNDLETVQFNKKNYFDPLIEENARFNLFYVLSTIIGMIFCHQNSMLAFVFSIVYLKMVRGEVLRSNEP